MLRTRSMLTDFYSSLVEWPEEHSNVVVRHLFTAFQLRLTLRVNIINTASVLYLESE